MASTRCCVHTCVTYLVCRLCEEGVAVLETEVSLRFSSQEAELSVLRVTGRVRDPPQSMSHMHTLQATKTHSVLRSVQRGTDWLQNKRHYTTHNCSVASSTHSRGSRRSIGCFIRTIKSRRMRWTGHEERLEDTQIRTKYLFLVV
jgi:hypothetical protein